MRFIRSSSSSWRSRSSIGAPGAETMWVMRSDNRGIVREWSLAGIGRGIGIFAHISSRLKKTPHRCNNVTNLGIRKVRVNWKTENAPCKSLGDRESSQAIAKRIRALLQMDGDRVVNSASDSMPREVFNQAVAFLKLDDERVVHAFFVSAVARNPHHIGEALAVSTRNFSAALVPRVEPLELDGRKSRLQRVETRVVTPDFTFVAVPKSVIAKFGNTFVDAATVRGDDSPVAHDPEVLDRMQAEAGGRTERADPTPLVASADRLGCVLDYRDSPVPCDIVDPIHIGRAAGQMHRDDRFCAGRDRPLEQGRIDVVVFGHIDKHRSGTDGNNHPRSG